MSRSAASRFSLLAVVSAVLLAFCLALVILLPTNENRGSEALSRIEIGPFRWDKASLPQVVADINEKIAEAGENRFRVRFANDIVHPLRFEDTMGGETREATVTLELPNKRPVTEVAVYVVEVSGIGLWPSSTPDGLLLASVWNGASHRPWRMKFKDWFDSQVYGIRKLWED